MGTVGGWGGDGGRAGVRRSFSFQTDEKEQGAVVPASLSRGNKNRKDLPPTHFYA